MAFQFGGGSSGGGGASGGWSAPAPVRSSPSPSPKKSEPSKKSSSVPNPLSSTSIPSLGNIITGGGGGGDILDIFVGGTVQTRGGGFTPEGSYSAGYHGSGEAPWIKGESDPGEYKSGSFGSIFTPDLSNPTKVSEYNRYLQSIGYNTNLLGIPTKSLFASIYDIVGKNVYPKANTSQTSAPVPTPVPTPSPTPSLEPKNKQQTIETSLFGISPKVDLLNPKIAAYTTYTPTYQAPKTNAYQKALATYNDLLARADMFGVGKDIYTTSAPIPNPVPTPATSTYKPSKTPVVADKQVSPPSVPTPTPIPEKPMSGMVNNVLKRIPTEYHEPAQQNIPLLVNAFAKRGITNPNQLAYGIATAQAEAGYVPKDEIRANPYSYDRRQRYIAYLQNNYEGGWKYHGRGYIQLTHKSNYEDMDRKLGLGGALVANPDLANDPQIAAEILAQFFQDRGVNALANTGNFVAARGPVNGTDRAWEIAMIANSIKKGLSNISTPTPTPTVASLFEPYNINKKT